MKLRILACIQAAALALSSFPTTAGTISTDNPVLVTEAETETGEELFSEIENTTGNENKDTAEIENVTETENKDAAETEDRTETKNEDVTETETQDATENETEDATETENETETETEDLTEPQTEAEDETLSETENKDASETASKPEDNADTAQYLTTIDAAAEKLRKSLTNREAEITVYYQTTENPDDAAAEEIWNAALKHTGKPTEGDYLRFQYESLEIPAYEITASTAAEDENSKTAAETTYYLPITYKVTYYTTQEQETELSTAVKEVINRFEWNEETDDYQKIKTIYDYICKNYNQNYDNTSSNNADDTLKHTAYAALISKTASNQGYASLLYRLLLECGIDARIISGTADGENHVWNIVKYGDAYYYLDAARDAEKTSYDCFLKGSDNFNDHTAEAAYTSEEFTTAHPISKTDAAVDNAENGSEDSEENKDNTEAEGGTEFETETESEGGTKTETEAGTEFETEAEGATETETETEVAAEAESDPTGRDGQKHDERPLITADGVLFPGKKSSGYSAVYTGEKICPTMTVIYTYQDNSGKSKKQTLKLNVDYTVTYKNNINAGGETATVIIKGIGEYQGTVTKEFSITKKSISKVTLSAVGDMKYTQLENGETPNVTVTDGAKELVEGTDYTVSWTEGRPDATTVSTLTVKAVESDNCNYTGTANKKAVFQILGADAENAVSITDAKIEWKNPNKIYTYNGKAQKPAVVVTDKDGRKVSSGSYKVIYANNVNAGTNTAKAYVVGVAKKGAGYYGISEPLTFTINQKSFNKVSASIKGTLPKFGTISDIQNAINEAVVVKDGKTVLSYGDDYTITYGSINSFDGINVGAKYDITILPVKKDGNYTSDTKTLKIKFGQINLASKTATVSLTIKNVELQKTTLMYNGATLEQNKDYTVTSIKQDKKTGLYTVKIKAVKGSAYKGSLTFKGVPFKALSMTLDKDMVTGETGETVQLNAVIPSGVQVSAITWKSSNQSVATVTDEGLVSMVGSGMAVITASANATAETEQLELTAQCQVIVKGKPEDLEFADVTDYGAVPDDGKDDWEAFQGALDNSENHTAYVPAGVYDIDLEKHNGIVMRRNYKLYMHKDAVLRSMKTVKEDCQVINVGSSGHQDDPDYYSNIEISGGTIIGDLRETGKDGEGVMGIRIQYAKNIYIHDVTIRECRGDGIYIGGNGKGSSNIFITGCTIADNSRNCLGIVSVHNLYVDNCKISGAGNLFGGKAPRACILIEKNKGDDICTDIVIKNSVIDNEAVCQSQSEAYAFGSSSARNEIHGDRLTVENCTFQGRVANYSTKNAKFINCTFNRKPIFKQDTIVQN